MKSAIKGRHGGDSLVGRHVVIRLKSGTVIEGDLVQELEGSYRVRNGTVTGEGYHGRVPQLSVEAAEVESIQLT